MAMWGVGLMVAPIMGPTVGGWITDNWNWRWNFYINVPIGIAAGLMVYTLSTIRRTCATSRAKAAPTTWESYAWCSRWGWARS